MGSSIFATYSTGENRVTASLLAVLRSLSLTRIDRILGALMEQSEFELIRFQNQVKKLGSVPDALIESNTRILIETKIKQNTVRLHQLRQHLSHLRASDGRGYLILLTSDGSTPSAVEKLKDKRLIWTTFAALHQAIDELLNDAHEVVSEREAFLLREFQSMLVDERLVPSLKEVVVVAARHAWPEYKKYSAYVCQQGRTFQQIQRIAFYSHGVIHELVPQVLSRKDDVVFSKRVNRGQLDNLVCRMLADSTRDEGKLYQVFLLSSPEDNRTEQLEKQIVNNLESKSGRPQAFTQGQRYASLESLRNARRTSELVDVAK